MGLELVPKTPKKLKESLGEESYRRVGGIHSKASTIWEQDDDRTIYGKIRKKTRRRDRQIASGNACRFRKDPRTIHGRI